VAYLATGQDFADALAGGPAAAVDDAPMLLSDPEALSPVIAEELRRLAPARIVLLGGGEALSPAVESAVAALAPVGRLAGADRYVTAAVISERVTGQVADTAYLATGTAFPDALTAVPAAILAGAPLMLVAPDAPPATATELARLGPARLVVLGGSDAISAEMIEAARSAATAGAG